MARILVVEDNAMMRTVILAALDRAGHQVTLAEDGNRALAAIAADAAFDLIVTDIEMPHMGGVDLIKAVRRSRPEAKILVISGRVPGAELKGMTSEKNLGAQGSLAKPFTADRLVAKVAEILG